MAHIAVDLGASGGRLIAGDIKGSHLAINEIHRFPNGMVKRGGHLFWDIRYIFDEVTKGIAKADLPIASVGIDTWGVDYALIDENGGLLSEVFAYRDNRTAGIPETLDQDFLYERTGICSKPINTLYQLIAHKDKKAARFLTIADYLHYLLCGHIACEYTMATTTQLINLKTGVWDDEIIAMTGFDRKIFPEIIQSGAHIGNMTDRPEIKVIVPAAHDTASAVAAIPAADTNFAYISSGTWSLMGIESAAPHISNKNFTNEGGVYGTYRVLKNIMGLWPLQEVRRLLPQRYSFDKLIELADVPFGSTVDINDFRFLHPDNMIDEIKKACLDGFARVPETPGQLTRCILDSLALGYKYTLDELREFAKIDKIHIVGGGSKNVLLNRVTALMTDCEIEAGPAEATAIGNILTQMIALGEIKDLKEGRALVAESFELEKLS